MSFVQNLCTCSHTLQWHRAIGPEERAECQFDGCDCKKYESSRPYKPPRLD